MKLVSLKLSSSKEKKSKRVNYTKSDKETQSESILVLIHILQVEQDEFKVEDLRGMYMCVPVLDCVCVCVCVCVLITAGTWQHRFSSWRLSSCACHLRFRLAAG